MTPSGSAEPPGGPWRSSSTTPPWSTPTRTPCCATKSPPPWTRPGSPCTTTTTAPSPATSPSPPWPAPSSARPSNSSASPRRRGPGADPDWAHRQGEAFVDLLEHLPTDRLHGKVAATLVITLDHDKLAAQVGAAGLDTGDQISASQTRRLACNAGLLPAVLDGTSQVLDLGRTQRFFTEAQRTALATRHTTCAAEGCDRPYAWCELHHRQPWSHGGTTNLRDAIPLCGYHHRQIHLRI